MILRRLASSLLPLIPEGLRSHLKRKRREARLQMIRTSNVTISTDSLVQALDAMRVKRDGVLFVHSSADWFQAFPGGALGLLRILQDYMEAGTLAMPAFPISGLASEYLSSNTFNVAKSPSQTGLVTELFRRTNGVLRSLHPTHSVCAKGRLSGWLLGEHHLNIRPFGQHSPFAKLSEAGGQILLLGVDTSVLTQVHVIEDKLRDRFPVSVYLPHPELVQIGSWGNDTLEIETLVHDPRVSRRKNIGKYESELLRRNIMQKTEVGGVAIRLIEAADLDRFLGEKAATGDTIYSG